MINAEAVAWTARAGATYRQLNYWISTGLVPMAVPNPGFGNARQYRHETAQVAATIAELLEAGLVLPAAASIARVAVHEHRHRFEIGPDIWLLVGDRSVA